MGVLCSRFYSFIFYLGYHGNRNFWAWVAFVILLPACAALLAYGRNAKRNVKVTYSGIVFLALSGMWLVHSSYLLFIGSISKVYIELSHCFLMFISLAYIIIILCTSKRRRLLLEIPIAFGFIVFYMRLSVPFYIHSGAAKYLFMFPFQMLCVIFTPITTILPEQDVVRSIVFLVIGLISAFGMWIAKSKLSQWKSSFAERKDFFLFGERILIFGTLLLFFMGHTYFYWAFLCVCVGYLLVTYNTFRIQRISYLCYSVLYSFFGGIVAFCCGAIDSVRPMINSGEWVAKNVSYLLPLPYGGVKGFVLHYAENGYADIFPQALLDMAIIIPFVVISICLMGVASDKSSIIKKSSGLYHREMLWIGFLLSSFVCYSLYGVLRDSIGLGVAVMELLGNASNVILSLLRSTYAFTFIFLLHGFILALLNLIPERVMSFKMDAFFIVMLFVLFLYSDLVSGIILFFVSLTLSIALLAVIGWFMDSLAGSGMAEKLYSEIEEEHSKKESFKHPDYVSFPDGTFYNVYKASDGNAYYYKPGKGDVYIYNNGTTIWDDEGNHYESTGQEYRNVGF